MREQLSAGEFEAITGLSPKALRLYGERGILSPASVDASTGYRSFDRDQIRHGVSLQLLRRAQVPMADLSASEFDFDSWRQGVSVRRALEDFYLDVAERVADFDPADLEPTNTYAPAVQWVGVVIDLDVPDGSVEDLATFSALTVTMPAIELAFGEAVAQFGEPSANAVWTAVPDATISGARKMLLARPSSVPLTHANRTAIEAHVLSLTGQRVIAADGTLPERLEVTFVDAVGGDRSAVDEAAAGYLELLAFERHLAAHGVTPISSTARQVVEGPILFSGVAPTSVFDVSPAASSADASSRPSHKE